MCYLANNFSKSFYVWFVILFLFIKIPVDTYDSQPHLSCHTGHNHWNHHIGNSEEYTAYWHCTGSRVDYNLKQIITCYMYQWIQSVSTHISEIPQCHTSLGYSLTIDVSHFWACLCSHFLFTAAPTVLRMWKSEFLWHALKDLMDGFIPAAIQAAETCLVT